MKSFGHSFHGLQYTYREELSFRMELASSIILIAFGWLAWPLRAWEFLALLFSFVFILVTELLNTALERALERLHPEQHRLIGASKDIASAAVLLSVVFAGLVVLAIGLSHYYASFFNSGLL